MRKTAIAITLLAWCATLAFAQTRDQRGLAVLPFFGGAEEDGEAIMALFEMELTTAFTVLPRGDTLEGPFREIIYQLRGGFTDIDTIVAAGDFLNADYVLTGSIRRLGDRNLVIAALLHVERQELVAGDWFTYYVGIGEVRNIIPYMSKNIADAARRDTSRLPNLAIVPLEIAGVSPQDAETLALILAIEMTRTGSYAVLPRMAFVRASAMAETDFQELGYTSEQDRAEVGRALNAQYTLAIRAHSLGGDNFFTAVMVSLMRGTQHRVGPWDFLVVEDGIHGMWEFALDLDLAGAFVFRGDDYFGRSEYIQAIEAFREALRHSPNHPRAGQRLGAAVEKATNTANAHVTLGNDYLNRGRFRRAVAEFEAALRLIRDHPTAYWYLQDARNAEMARARFHSIGLSVGTSLAEPWAVGTVQITFSPWRFGFFRLGCDFGIITGVRYADYQSIYPFIQYGLFLPFGGWGGLHLGVGGGLIMERFGIDALDIEVQRNIPAADITTGLVMWNRIDISYTLRADLSYFPDFSNIVLTQKISVGVIHRFARPSRRR